MLLLGLQWFFFVVLFFHLIKQENVVFAEPQLSRLVSLLCELFLLFELMLFDISVC